MMPRVSETEKTFTLVSLGIDQHNALEIFAVETNNSSEICKEDLNLFLILKLLRMGEQKGHSTRFSPITYTNVRVSPQNFLTFSYNPFTTPV